jgi:hypothetical protein
MGPVVRNNDRPQILAHLSRRADRVGGPGLFRQSLLHECIAYDATTMAQSRSRAALRTALRIGCDLLRLVSAAARSDAELAAENVPEKAAGIVCGYVERQVKPRRADNATRIALVALSWLIE